MKRLIVLFTVVIALSGIARSQGGSQQQVNLDLSSHNQKFYTCDAVFYDNKPNGNYAPSIDYWTTFCPTSANQRIRIEFETFTIDPTDTVFIYYGEDIYAQPAVYTAGKAYFQNNDLQGGAIEPPITDTSGCLTFRLKSDNLNTADGWKANVSCVKICQDVIGAIAPTFEKISSSGVRSTMKVRDDWAIDWIDLPYKRKEIPSHDSTFVDDKGKTHYLRRDTIWFKAIDICEGDSIILTADPQFPYNDNAYHQAPENCIYYWNFGDQAEFDTIEFNPVASHRWMALSGYDLELTVLDTANGGCITKNSLGARVRMATNPIKTVEEMMDTICSGERLLVSVGMSGSDIVKLDTIRLDQTSKEIFDTRMFIPDGGSADGGQYTYKSEVVFTSFSAGSIVNTSKEIASVCLNIEHSNISDLGIRLVCPNGQSTTLKYNTSTTFQTFLGIPFYAGKKGLEKGYLSPETGDSQKADQRTDSTYNPIGQCWNYCFSNTLLKEAQGVMQGTVPNHMRTATMTEDGNIFVNDVLDSTHYYEDTMQFFQTPIQGILGNTNYNKNGNQTQEYISATTVDKEGFSTLIGCPLNGTWSLQITDNQKKNNGWLCQWWVDIDKSAATSWTYQVPIDTVRWQCPPINVIPKTNVSANIAPTIKQSGKFKVNIEVEDDFKCVWPATSNIFVIGTPQVDLGPDLDMCEGDEITLDAGIKSASAYAWEPTGETTRKITVKSNPNEYGAKQYAVRVTNGQGKFQCYGGDTVVVNIHPGANASFRPEFNPLEGCEPYVFKLQDNSTNAKDYLWTISNSVEKYTSTEPSPTFSLPLGQYDLSLHVTSDYGCSSEISYKKLINVYSSPAADFGWNPSIPYTQKPTVTMVNKTIPDDSTNVYRWEIQTNKFNHGDIVNIFGATPTYTWTPQQGHTTAGEYNVTLDAYSHHYAPSGNLIECHDTVTKVITIINDNLFFPTVVTPNGDGVNDIFEIRNLLDGEAFPDNELTIFNRYGKQVYFVQDIRNPEQFWDPAKTNSPTGTYFYRFIGRGPTRNVDFTGSVEILTE